MLELLVVLAIPGIIMLTVALALLDALDVVRVEAHRLLPWVWGGCRRWCAR